MKISIIIPTFNRKDKIERCINSIINQITIKDEIIVIDDCSQDDTVDVLEKIHNKYSNIILKRNNINKGVSYSRNLGLQIATGDLIIFIDSDDVCSENMIKEYLKIYERTKASIVCSGLIYKNEKTSEEFIKTYNANKVCTKKEEILEELLKYETKGLLYSSCNKMYLKDILCKNDIRFNTKTSNLEDYEFNCEYIKYCDSVYFTDKALYYYMISDEESLSSMYVEDLFERYKFIKAKRLETYSLILLNNKTNKESIERLNIEFLFGCINNLYRKNSKTNKRQRIKILEEILKQEEIHNYKEKSCDNNYFKIMLKIVKIKDIHIIDTTLKILHFLKCTLNRIYLKVVRKKFIKKEKNL